MNISPNDFRMAANALISEANRLERLAAEPNQNIAVLITVAKQHRELAHRLIDNLNPAIACPSSRRHVLAA